MYDQMLEHDGGEALIGQLRAQTTTDSDIRTIRLTNSRSTNLIR